LVLAWTALCFGDIKRTSLGILIQCVLKESKWRQKRRKKSRPKVKFMGGKALLVTGIAGMKRRSRIFIARLIMNRVMRKGNFVASTIKGLLFMNLNLEVCKRSSQ